ncbi:MAG: hypothetical protein ABEH64_10420 [Salinirussus sp.]
MPGPDRLRDSTQIRLQPDALEGIELEEEFAVTVRCEDGTVRIIGSPVVIKKVSNFLARSGVAVD